MRVLIADKLHERGRHALEDLGLAVTYLPDADAGALGGLAVDHEVLIVHDTPVVREALDVTTSLQLVVCAGADTGTIDIARASELGIFVATCPGKDAVAVAELALGLLMALDRRIPHAAADLKAGRWNRSEYGRARGILGRTLGVAGVGTIGRELIVRAGALGMSIVGWSRSLTDEQAAALGIERAPDLETLASRCDTLSIHLAHSAETQGIVGRAVLDRLPKGALLVNTSHGGIVDERALLAAIETRQIRYAADVFDHEPPAGVAETQHRIATHPDVVATPHIAASTEQARVAVSLEAARIVESFIVTGKVPGCVNQRTHSPAEWQLTVRHLDRIGVLASVLAKIREAEINVHEIENVVFDGATAACACIRIDREPPVRIVEAIGSLEHVLDARVICI